MKIITDFFNSEVQRAAGEEGLTIYKMANSTGEGIITRCEVLPGIELFYNNFHMRDGENQNKCPRSGVIEINHCRKGRFECMFNNRNCVYIGEGDLTLNRLTNTTIKTSFPMNHYQGISITLELETASNTLNRISKVFGGLGIDLYLIAGKLCSGETCFVLRGRREIEHIFSELYRISPQKMASFLKIKVLELLMFLNELKPEDCSTDKRYFSRHQVETVKEVHNFLTENIRSSYTQEELAERFGISLTAMKNCFKGIYGCSIYTYITIYRMQAAAELLTRTDESIADISGQVGYGNPSKFARVFKKEFHMQPSKYRKKMSE